LADGSGWRVEIDIYVADDLARDVDGQDIPEDKVSLAGTFSTQQEAIEAAIIEGRRRVDGAVKSEDIHSLIEEETQLPSTHRHGYGGWPYDVAVGSDGVPKKVPTPETPEDRFN
jgi:hypothetical protein